MDPVLPAWLLIVAVIGIVVSFLPTRLWWVRVIGLLFFLGSLTAMLRMKHLPTHSIQLLAAYYAIAVGVGFIGWMFFLKMKPVWVHLLIGIVLIVVGLTTILGESATAAGARAIGQGLTAAGGIFMSALSVLGLLIPH